MLALAWGAALLCWVADAFRQSCSYGPLARGGYWLALGAALAGWRLAGSGKLLWRGWLLAGSGSCSGGVATGWLWEAALAGWLLAGSGSCSGGVATGWLWELLWRGGDWLDGSLEYSTVM